MVIRDGTLGVVGSPVHLSDDGFALRFPPPQVGAHGDAILAEHAFAPAEIAELRKSGTLA